MRRRYDEFFAGNRFLSEARTIRRKGHRIPHGGSLRRLNSRRVVLAGDAADLVDPLTGEGIYHALRSGQLAGEAIAGFLLEGTPLDRYGDLVRDTMQHELRRARRCAELLYRHPGLAYHLLLRNALVASWFVEILNGDRSYASLRRTLIREAVKLPFHALSRNATIHVP
jgi:flavin-dependent dehydrogenase